jgi:ACS family hexuronate transporter-like MFS transporter
MDGLAVARRELTALWAGGNGKTLAAIASGWGLLIGTRMVYPVILPQLSAEFDLTLTTAGFLVTIIWLTYALGQVPGGILADRYGERKLLPLSILIFIVGIGLVIFAPTAVILFVATGLAGAGLSLYPIARITALSDLYPDRLGRVLGVTMATGDISQTVIPPIAGVLTAALAWQVGLGFVLPLLIPVAIALWLTVPRQAPSDSAVDQLSAERIESVVEELRQPTLVLVGVILFLYMLVWQMFSAFYPTYLIDVKGLSPAVASGLFSLFFAVGVLVKPIGGMAYDKIGMRKSLPIVLSGSIIGFAALPVTTGVWGLVIVTILISTMLGSGTVTQSFLAETIPEDMQGTGLGTIRSTAATLGAMGPVLFGAIAERGYFDEGYVLLAVLVGGITLLTFRLPRE